MPQSYQRLATRAGGWSGFVPGQDLSGRDGGRRRPPRRYDLAEVDDQTQVTLTYDWSTATPEARQRFAFPPFGVDKLRESLDNLATLAT